MDGWDLSDLHWQSVGDLSVDTPTYTIAYDPSPLTFRERLKMAWQFLWTGKMDFPDRLIAFWENEASHIERSTGAGYPAQDIAE